VRDLGPLPVICIDSQVVGHRQGVVLDHETSADHSGQMERVIEVGVLHSLKPGTAVLLVEVKVLKIAWIEEGPAVGWVDSAGVRSDAIHGVDLVSRIEQPLYDMSPDEAGGAGHEDLTHC